ncbi:hypothetical protein D6833_01760 [Candidatus Parcubacteria bacterium]|nr:MAG: hypothetical protein D6833_01760 [Candidatus Parcubacteria bacterium]
MSNKTYLGLPRRQRSWSRVMGVAPVPFAAARTAVKSGYARVELDDPPEIGWGASYRAAC